MVHHREKAGQQSDQSKRVKILSNFREEENLLDGFGTNGNDLPGMLPARSQFVCVM